MDVLTKEQRRRAMQGNTSDNTTIEVRLRKALWAKGYRFRKNYKKLPGKPDIVLVKYRLAIFCDSEFWHGYRWKQKKAKLKTNRSFWIKKIEANKLRDKKNNRDIRRLGWRVLRFWGEQINSRLDSCVKEISRIAKKKN